jgi:hypothetical protein
MRTLPSVSSRWKSTNAAEAERMIAGSALRTDSHNGPAEAGRLRRSALFASTSTISS